MFEQRRVMLGLHFGVALLCHSLVGFIARRKLVVHPGKNDSRRVRIYQQNTWSRSLEFSLVPRNMGVELSILYVTHLNSLPVSAYIT